MPKKSNSLEIQSIVEAIAFIKSIKDKADKGNPVITRVLDADEHQLQDELFRLMQSNLATSKQ